MCFWFLCSNIIPGTDCCFGTVSRQPAGIIRGVSRSLATPSYFFDPCFPVYDFYGKIKASNQVRRPILCRLFRISARWLAPKRVP